jgi:hypothetical protein
VVDLTYLDVALTCAAHRGHVEIAKMLIEAGARLMQVQLIAAVEGGHMDMVRLLKDAKLICHDFQFVLHHAIELTRLTRPPNSDMVDLILEFDQGSSFDWSLAITAGNFKMLRMCMPNVNRWQVQYAEDEGRMDMARYILSIRPYVAFPR